MPADADRRALVLASTSPRRRELFANLGRDFEVRPAGIDETPREDESPETYVRRLSLEKARAAAASLDGRSAVVVAADTTVVHQGRLLGKPADSAHAADILRDLRGKSHEVLTGLTVIDPDGQAWTDLARSIVRMRGYSDSEIDAYVATGDPLDKAGAYAIQHAGFRPVERVDGCPANVVGLPMCHVVPLLRQAGIEAGDRMPVICRTPHAGACAVFSTMDEGRILG